MGEKFVENWVRESIREHKQLEKKYTPEKLRATQKEVAGLRKRVIDYLLKYGLKKTGEWDGLRKSLVDAEMRLRDVRSFLSMPAIPISAILDYRAPEAKFNRKYTQKDLQKAGKTLYFWRELRSKGEGIYFEHSGVDPVRMIINREYEKALAKHQEIGGTFEKEREEKIVYTLKDLEEERQWDGGNGPNNPGAFRRQLREHNERRRKIEESLRRQGLLK
jgi:hypothetical protein